MPESRVQHVALGGLGVVVDSYTSSNPEESPQWRIKWDQSGLITVCPAADVKLISSRDEGATALVTPHPSLGLVDLKPLPTDFDFVSHVIDLVSLTAQRIQSLIRRSVPRAKLVSLRRFANKRLWRRYVTCRADIAEENSGNPNVRLLFHGTKEPSKILGSGLDSNSEGFDFRLSNAGSYGKGSYFAIHAAYPVSIYPRRKNQDGSFSLIIAEVACGKIKEFGDAIDRTLTRPPIRAGALRYNSVQGTENRIGIRHPHRDRHDKKNEHGKQIVIYDQNQAYPHYLARIEIPPFAVHHFAVFRTRRQKGANNRIHWDTVHVTDPSGAISLSENKDEIVFAQPGLYRFMVRLAVKGGFSYIRGMKNGREFCTSYGDTLAPLEDVFAFAAGDTLRIDSSHNISTRDKFGLGGTSDNMIIVERM